MAIEVGTLYLDAARYRAGLEKRCRRGSAWVQGTPSRVLLELMEHKSAFVNLDPAAVLRYQNLIELLHRYIAANKSNRAEIPSIASIVTEAYDAATLRAQELDRRGLLKVRDDKFRVLGAAIQRLAKETEALFLPDE